MPRSYDSSKSLSWVLPCKHSALVCWPARSFSFCCFSSFFCFPRCFLDDGMVVACAAGGSSARGRPRVQATIYLSESDISLLSKAPYPINEGAYRALYYFQLAEASTHCLLQILANLFADILGTAKKFRIDIFVTFNFWHATHLGYK